MSPTLPSFPALPDRALLDRLRAVRPTEVARAAYGVCELVAPAALAQHALGVRRNARERTVARLLGARHVAQAVLTTVVPDPRVRLVGGGVDALHSLSMVAWALAERRRHVPVRVGGRGRGRVPGRGPGQDRARQAWGEAVSAALFAGAELAPLLPPLVQARPRLSAGSALARRGTTPAGPVAVSGDGSSLNRVPPPPDPERQRRQRTAVRQQVIAEIAERGEGRPVRELARELEEALSRRGLDAEPRTWLRAVAADAAIGNVYVISEEAIRDAGLEMPSSRGR
jgi:hypothetical protein